MNEDVRLLLEMLADRLATRAAMDPDLLPAARQALRASEKAIRDTLNAETKF